MPLETWFLSYFGGFWIDFGGMLASKMDSRSMLSSRGHFSKKHHFSWGKTMILKDPGIEVGSKNRSKIDPKSMSTSKGVFLHKPSFSLGKSMILKDPGVEVGSKNRSKIDQKMRSTWEGILASIFHRCWWILGVKLGGTMEAKSVPIKYEFWTNKLPVIMILANRYYFKSERCQTHRKSWMC